MSDDKSLAIEYIRENDCSLIFKGIFYLRNVFFLIWFLKKPFILTTCYDFQNVHIDQLSEPSFASVEF
jgi:hypothetical protein